MKSMNSRKKRISTLVFTLILTTSMAVTASASLRDAVKDVRDSKQEIRQERRDIKEDKRDLGQALRQGDKSEAREALGDLREDRKDLLQERRDLIKDRQELKREALQKMQERQEAERANLKERLSNNMEAFIQPKQERIEKLAPIREKVRNKLELLRDPNYKDKIEEIAEEQGLSQDEIAEAMSEELKTRIKNGVNSAELRSLARLQGFLKNHDGARQALMSAIGLNPGDKELLKEYIEAKKNAQDKSLEVFVGGIKPKFDVSPVVEEGRSLVPLRAIVEALGADVKWDPDTRTITINRGDKEVKLTLEQKIAYVNGQPVELDVPAKAIEGRTVVPLRFLGQGLDMNVGYDSQVVTVEEPIETDANQPQTSDPSPQTQDTSDDAKATTSN